MGDIINLKLRDQAGRPSAGHGAAKILFFTGVRYQRDDADKSRPAPGPSAPDGHGGKLGGRRRRRG
jgi:hypothetical protein